LVGLHECVSGTPIRYHHLPTHYSSGPIVVPLSERNRHLHTALGLSPLKSKVLFPAVPIAPTFQNT
jgi:hypothetical protein